MVDRATYDSPAAQAFITRMLAALAAKPMTRAEMQDELFASKTKMLNYIRLLHGDLDAPKRIYIASYDDRETGGRNPRYSAGAKKDAAPPGSRTEAERWKACKGNPEQHRRRKAKLRAAAVVKRSRAKPQPWFAALMGVA